SRLQLSLPGAVQFLRAYQEDAPLTIAELWAFPTMLRLACSHRFISNLLSVVIGRYLALDPAPDNPTQA
ncbi:MAG TPA: hypothetical protein VIK28_05575, partial [Sedimentisphaerales bacterium]